ncbi:MAG: hypothetical protein OHK006_07640 [Thermodesulfovibrionales bacterium]
MKETDCRTRVKSPCAVTARAVPEFVTCPECGGEVELWTDEDETACFFCGYKVFKKEKIVH